MDVNIFSMIIDYRYMPDFLTFERLVHGFFLGLRVLCFRYYFSGE